MSRAIEKLNFKQLLLIIILTSLASYLPILIFPGRVLNRSNDLDLYFWPLFIYIKRQIGLFHTVPLWNTMYLSGTPLISNPQSPVFYLPNTIFLFLPIGTAFIVTMVIHSILGGAGMYLLSKNAFRFSKLASLFTAALFVTSPQLFGYMQAGHYGLILSFAWIPWVLLAVYKISVSPQKQWLALLAVSGAATYLNHALTATVLGVFSALFFLYLTISTKRFNIISCCRFGLGWLLALGLCAVTLLPQLEWSSRTTRALLIQHPETYPKWSGARDFLVNLLAPWVRGAYNTDSEKWIATGLVLTGLSIYGLKRLPLKPALGLVLVVLAVTLISLNNSSPLYGLLLKQDWYLVLRVGTRLWFILTIVVIMLAGWSLENIHKTKPALAFLLISLALGESAFLSWSRTLQLPPNNTHPVPAEIISYLKQDHGLFRVFCLSRCISQKQAAENNLELIEGYDTLIQMNYYKQAWQLTGAYWNYYSLSVPPFGALKYQKLKPDLSSLGDFNTKYIISLYYLDIPNLSPVYQNQGYLVYRNPFFLPRAYYPEGNQQQPPALTYYSPDLIRVDTLNHRGSRLVLANVYSPGWKAYLNGTDYSPVLEKPDALSLVNLRPDTKSVDFRYQPDSYIHGLIISSSSVLAVLYLIFNKRWIKHGRPFRFWL